MQGALSSFIDSGHYNNYIYKLKSFYGSRMRLLKHELEGFLDFNLEHRVPNNGMFSLIKLPNTNIEEFINIMSTKDISIRDGSHFYLKEFNHVPSLRISLCNVNEDKIIKGMNYIFQELKNSQYNSPLNSCQQLEL